MALPRASPRRSLRRGATAEGAAAPAAGGEQSGGGGGGGEEPDAASALTADYDEFCQIIARVANETVLHNPATAMHAAGEQGGGFEHQLDCWLAETFTPQVEEAIKARRNSRARGRRGATQLGATIRPTPPGQ